MIHVFTSSAPNYVGKVRALCQSLREHCPEVATHWLVADMRSRSPLAGVDDDAIDEVLFVDDFERLREPRWLFQHDMVELATAIKPEVALSLLARDDCDLLLYFDPDMVVFSPLDDLVSEARSSSVALTPHLLKPEKEHDAVLDHELCSLRHGVFNLGFVGVRDCAEGVRFLEWWRDRCRAFCWNDWQSGVFTDQKWVNFAPVFFPETRILRSPRFNVAPWNINQRRLEGTFEEGFLVDGEPLGFYHFTGFDSGAHAAVIHKYAGGNEAALALIAWYAWRTKFLAPAAGLDWGLRCFDNGEEIASAHRHIYRDRLDLEATFPDPFQTTETEPGLLGWPRQTGPVEYPEKLAAETVSGPAG